MKITAVIETLERFRHSHGDLDVMSCGLDGDGWCNLDSVTVHKVVPSLTSTCEYRDALEGETPLLAIVALGG